MPDALEAGFEFSSYAVEATETAVVAGRAAS